MSAELPQKYFQEIQGLLAVAQETQMEDIVRSGESVGDAVAGRHETWVFGAGHSHMMGEEVFARAGGLVGVLAILEPDVMPHLDVWRSSDLERTEGLAERMLEKYPLRSGDEMIVASNSGRNVLPIEVARLARERGLVVIALTSRRHSLSVASRHSSGKWLLDIAHIVLDNGCPPGDAVLEVPGSKGKACRTSTALGTVILNAVMAAAIDHLREPGVTPPIYISANLDGADAHNKALSGV